MKKSLSLLLMFLLTVSSFSYAQRKIHETSDGYTIYENNKKYYLYDKDLKQISGRTYSGMNFFYDSERNARYVLFSTSPDARNVGLMTPQGKIILNEIYQSMMISERSDTSAFVVRKEGKYAILSPDLRSMTGFVYDRIEFFYVSSRNTYIGFKFWQNGKKGFMSSDYRIIYKPLYDDIEYYNETKLALKQNGKHSIGDLDGKITVSTHYEFRNKFRTGHVTAKENNKWGIIDAQGAITIPFIYDDMYVLGLQSKPLLQVRQNNKSGIITMDNKVVLPIEYDEITNPSPFTVFYPRKGPLMGAINPDKGVDIPAEYNNVRKVSGNDTCFVVRKNGKSGMVNQSNKPLVPIRYDSLGMTLVNGFISCMLNNKWGYYSIEKGETTAPVYTSVGYVNVSVAKVMMGNKYGLVDLNGRFIIEARYEDINPVFDVKNQLEYIDFKEKGVWGRMDQNMKVITSAR